MLRRSAGEPVSFSGHIPIQARPYNSQLFRAFFSRQNRLIFFQLKRIEFRGDLVKANSLFVNLVLDIRATAGQSCDNMYVYIADSTAPAIVVYDVRSDRGWRLTTPEMYPSPDHGTFKVSMKNSAVEYKRNACFEYLPTCSVMNVVHYENN